MHCPKCNHQQSNQIECEACGLIFAKYEEYLERRKERETRKGNVKEKSGGGLNFMQVLLLILVTAGVTYYFFGKKEEQQLSQTPEAPPVITQNYQDEAGEQEEQYTQESGSYATQQTEEVQVVQGSPIQHARNATVSIETPWGTGSGFFINDQFIVTNKHVVEFNTKDIEELRKKVEKGRKLIDLEEDKISSLKKQKREIPDGPSREQLAIIIQSLEENLNKYLPQQEQAEQKLAELEMGVEPSDIKIVLSDGSEYEANYLLVSENYDLALMSLYTNKSLYLQRPPSGQHLRQGDKVYTVGSPVGLRHTVTAGIFSGYRKITNTNQRYLQTDAAINPGNSGGPLIDERGFVYGVNTMILKNTEGIGFAIPIDVVYEEFGSELY